MVGRLRGYESVQRGGAAAVLFVCPVLPSFNSPLSTATTRSPVGRPPSRRRPLPSHLDYRRHRLASSALGPAPTAFTPRINCNRTSKPLATCPTVLRGGGHASSPAWLLSSSWTRSTSETDRRSVVHRSAELPVRILQARSISRHALAPRHRHGLPGHHRRHRRRLPPLPTSPPPVPGRRRPRPRPPPS